VRPSASAGNPRDVASSCAADGGLERSGPSAVDEGRDVITDEDRVKLGDLAMRAIDAVLDEYGEDAVLEDAVLVYEVSYPDPDHEGETATTMSSETTTHRATVAGGLAAAYAATQLAPWASSDDD
jgi:hypothetical protein